MQPARAWGPGDGLHQVTVLSGALSVDDGRRTCVYRAGEGYVAGWAPYTARSVDRQGAEAVVTYLGRSHSPAAPSAAERRSFSAPDRFAHGCTSR